MTPERGGRAPVPAASRRATVITALAAFAGSTFVVVLFAAGNVLARTASDRPARWVPALIFSAAQWYAWALCAPVLFQLVRRYGFGRVPAIRAAALVVAAAPVVLLVQLALERTLLRAGFAIASVVPVLEEPMRGVRASPWRVRFERGLGFGVFSYVAVVLGAHAWLYYDLFQGRALRESRLEAELARTRLDALRAQLHPHFLFNTLNSIAGLLHANPAAADRMLVNVSDLLRHLLRDEPEVALRDELELLGAYLEIEQIRLGERLRVRHHVDPAVEDALVPPLLVQPLVENAIRHAIEPRERGGSVEIAIARHADRLTLLVRNDGGEGVAARTDGSGVGLSNTRRRLETLYGSGHRMTAGVTDVGGFAVEIELPYRVRR